MIVTFALREWVAISLDTDLLPIQHQAILEIDVQLS